MRQLVQGNARDRIVGVLDRMRLRDAARIAREGVRLVRQGEVAAELRIGRRVTHPSPLPPMGLVYLVNGRLSRTDFHEGGRAAAAYLRSTLEKVGVDLDDQIRVLDFGCGCGRILRWWAGQPGPVYGCDYNPRLVSWCASQLPNTLLTRNDLLPPTPFESGFFDVVYAHSVLTHLTPDVQLAWMQEWARLLRPGGLLLVTTHGPTTCPDAALQAELARTGTLTRAPNRNGENLCAVYNTADDVRNRLGRGLELILEDPAAMPGSGQDVWVFHGSSNSPLLGSVSPAAPRSPRRPGPSNAEDVR